MQRNYLSDIANMENKMSQEMSKMNEEFNQRMREWEDNWK